MSDFLHNYITDFFTTYLPEQRGFSENTITSYKYNFIILLEFLKERYNLNINKLIVTDLDKNKIIEYINFLDKEKKCSVSTTNQRICAIHSFYKYLQRKDIKYFDLSAEILQIKTKKKPQNEMYYLNKQELMQLFKIFNLKDKKQLRDYTIIALLYDSGARVQELIDLVSSDVSFSNNTLKLYGKGSKVRIVPISSQVIKLLKKYFDIYKIESNSNELLFLNSQKRKLTREGIKYIIQKYAKMCNLDYKRITPHSFRHTKAMHMLENNVNLVYIRDFLGHKSITVTEIYAKANPEVKRKAIENLSNEILTDKKYSNNKKEELLEWLKSSV